VIHVPLRSTLRTDLTPSTGPPMSPTCGLLYAGTTAVLPPCTASLYSSSEYTPRVQAVQAWVGVLPLS
jgi:hypothetical protein